MVSKVRASREQPNWIGDTLWKQMTSIGTLKKPKRRVPPSSAARMSERNGLGPYVHFSGQKSCLQIQQEMEEELGRPVSLGEVFIKVHKKQDETFVDRKSKNVADAYRKNLESKLADLGIDSETSDGTSPSLGLTIKEENEIFLQGLFEDLKADRTEDDQVRLFRPDENALSMQTGADRHCMTPPSVEQFIEAVKQTVPPPGKGVLYTRPRLIGSGAILGAAPAPEYTFLIYASPAGDYHKVS
ncbi:uncharacterized protein LOC112089964 [Eutrema salsugineum]|uniref:uncharacterized protein LOC112089964 n=1 Tax=Eutrema salsugineum TaxID=72664 RepID=UPI000CED1FF4|nr:uncharacterized protein LOC112089964 [Eutrema salsugineum]